jgi:outer membrane protein TolC
MRLLATCVLLAALAAPALAQPSRDTLADAVDSAISNNPVLLAERQSRAAADETLEQARAALRPSLGLNATAGTQELGFGRTVNTPSGSFPLDGRQERATIGLEARQTLAAGIPKAL